MRAETDFQKAYQSAPERARSKRGDYAEGNVYERGSLYERAHKHGRNAAHNVLTFRTYIEHACFECEGDGKAGEYIRHGIFNEAIRNILCGAEYNAEQLAI